MTGKPGKDTQEVEGSVFIDGGLQFSLAVRVEGRRG